MTAKLTLGQRLAAWLTRLALARHHVKVLRTRIAARKVRGVLAGRGPDVSNYQGTVDWVKIKAAGARFGVCKATEGVTFNDPTFAQNWAAMKKVGLRRVAYHFAHPGSHTPRQEAQHFASVVREHGYQHGVDLVVLDIETENGPKIDLWCDEFFAELRAQLGPVEEIEYTYASFHSWAPRPHRKVWIASYGKSFSVPVGRTRAQVMAWQYSDHEQWPGVSRPCDSNRAL